MLINLSIVYFNLQQMFLGSVVLCNIRNISYQADNEAMRRNPKNREEINKFGNW